MTPAAMAAHVHELGRAFDVRVIESDQLKPDEALGIAGMRLVLCRPVVDETSYAVALHELGHLCAPLGIVRQAVMAGGMLLANAMRLEEAAAWEWARHYALHWSPVMERLAEMCEATYSQEAEEAARRRQQPRPTPQTKPINWSDWK